MSQTTASTTPDVGSQYPDTAPSREGQAPDPGKSAAQRHGRSWRHFVRHLLEMLAAMWIGMVVGVGVFVAITGVSYKRSLHEYPSAALLVMAVSMTVPMVAWMRFRRHTWRNSLEMGAAMLLPAVPFWILVLCHVYRQAPNRPYMNVSLIAMLALMLYRRDVYSAHHPARRRPLMVPGVDDPGPGEHW